MQDVEAFLAHHGVKGMRWGVRRDERALSLDDKALNLSQRSQVKIASGISALAAIGISSNAAATAFQLQSRWEHLKLADAVMKQAENNPLLSQSGREALKAARSNIIKGLVTSAAVTTAISTTIGVVTHRTAKAYFAPIHKVYKDVKPKINSEMRQLSKDIKAGKRPSMTDHEYHAEVAKIVSKYMTQDKSNIVQPFHELARSQLGLEYNTKSLDIQFEKLPNTDLYSKMTVTTPTGLKIVKAVKNLEHADMADDDMPDLDLYFNYKFDSDGFITDFSCPTLEIANDMFEGTFDINDISAADGSYSSMTHANREDGIRMNDVETFLAHHGVKGMHWGVRKGVFGAGEVDLAVGSASNAAAIRNGSGASDKQVKKLFKENRKDTEKVLGLAHAYFNDKAETAKYNDEANKYVDSVIKSGVKSTSIDKYRAHMAGVLSKGISDYMVQNNITGVHVKTFPSGPDQFQYVIGDKDTVDSVLNDIGVANISHGDLNALVMFNVTFNLDETGHLLGYDVEDLNPSMSHADLVEDFLAHYGIKGMRWGVRRSDKELGNPDGGSNGVTSKSGVQVTKSKLAGGSGEKLTRAEKKSVLAAARAAKKTGGKAEIEIDNAHDVKLSADAERFVRTRLKASHEMSDREIKEAIKRQQDVDTYNKLFAPDANKILKDQVEALTLQKQYAQLKAEMNPSKMDKAASFIKKASDTYSAVPAPLRSLVSKQLSDLIKNADTSGSSSPKASSLPKQPKLKKQKFRNPGPSSSSDSRVHNITGMGTHNPMDDPVFGDPNLLALPSARHSAVEELFAANGIMMHADQPTVQDIYDGMTALQQDAANLMFGAMADGDDSIDGTTLVDGSTALSDVYDTMTDLEKAVIDYIAGGIDSTMAQAEEVENFLAHHGVKGMRWGVRKGVYGQTRTTSSGERGTIEIGKKLSSDVRNRVKAGTGSLNDAHLAALKSRGRRVANAFLGDKTYWKHAAMLAGFGFVGGVAALTIPGLLPAHILIGIAGSHAGVGATVGAKIAAGKAMATAYSLTALSVVGKVAAVKMKVSNARRAIYGNRRINQSMADLGTKLHDHQSAGSAQTRKLLNQSGRLSKKSLDPKRFGNQIKK